MAYRMLLFLGRNLRGGEKLVLALVPVDFITCLTYIVFFIIIRQPRFKAGGKSGWIQKSDLAPQLSAEVAQVSRRRLHRGHKACYISHTLDLLFEAAFFCRIGRRG
jgi:hypothetical protein